MGRVEGKACVVTGAGSGIGKAIAERLAEEGGSVLCVDINGGASTATAEAIRTFGGIAASFTADISDSKQVEAFVADCVNRYGSIDVLINNAGVNIPGSYMKLPTK